MKTIPTRAEEVIRGVCAEQNVVLLEVVVRGSEQRPVVEVYIDTPEGITLEHCREIHAALGDAIDREKVLPMTYRLDVSSPGIDRPLQYSWQFQRNTDRLVELRLNDGTAVFGRIIAVQDEMLELRPERPLQGNKQKGGSPKNLPQKVVYPLQDIISTLIHVEW